MLNTGPYQYFDTTGGNYTINNWITCPSCGFLYDPSHGWHQCWPGTVIPSYPEDPGNLFLQQEKRRLEIRVTQLELEREIEQLKRRLAELENDG